MNLAAKVIKYIVTTSFSLIFFIKEHKIPRKQIILEKSRKDYAQNPSHQQRIKICGHL